MHEAVSVHFVKRYLERACGFEAEIRALQSASPDICDLQIIQALQAQGIPVHDLWSDLNDRLLPAAKAGATRFTLDGFDVFFQSGRAVTLVETASRQRKEQAKYNRRRQTVGKHKRKGRH